MELKKKDRAKAKNLLPSVFSELEGLLTGTFLIKMIDHKRSPYHCRLLDQFKL